MNSKVPRSNAAGSATRARATALLRMSVVIRIEDSQKSVMCSVSDMGGSIVSLHAEMERQ